MMPPASASQLQPFVRMRERHRDRLRIGRPVDEAPDCQARWVEDLDLLERLEIPCDRVLEHHAEDLLHRLRDGLAGQFHEDTLSHLGATIDAMPRTRRPSVHLNPYQRTAYLDQIERSARRLRIDAERRAAQQPADSTADEDKDLPPAA